MDSTRLARILHAAACGQTFPARAERALESLVAAGLIEIHVRQREGRTRRAHGDLVVLLTQRGWSTLERAREQQRRRGEHLNPEAPDIGASSPKIPAATAPPPTPREWQATEEDNDLRTNTERMRDAAIQHGRQLLIHGRDFAVRTSKEGWAWASPRLYAGWLRLRASLAAKMSRNSHRRRRGPRPISDSRPARNVAPRNPGRSGVVG